MKGNLPNIFPIRKEDGLHCPDDDTKLVFEYHNITMMDRYRMGNEYDEYTCPKCKRYFRETTIYRD